MKINLFFYFSFLILTILMLYYTLNYPLDKYYFVLLFVYVTQFIFMIDDYLVNNR